MRQREDFEANIEKNFEAKIEAKNVENFGEKNFEAKIEENFVDFPGI